jgi:hypothetical protein
MNCEHYEAALNDLVDGTIDPATAGALDAHLAGCSSCRAMAEDFRAIRAAALTLERHVPPARTWHRIADAVDADRGSRRFAWLAWRPLAAAAAVLVMLSGTWLMLRPATQPAPAATAESSSPEFDLQNTEAEYEMAIAGLEQITSAGGMELDPMTAEVLKANLSVIDMAIDESRAALQTEPSNDVAQESLFAALNTKLALLQNTVALINEMRNP